MKPKIPSFFHRNLASCSFYSQHFFYTWAVFQCFVYDSLQLYFFTSSVASIRTNDQFTFAVINSGRKCSRRKPSKNHHMNSANSRTSQHSYRQFYHHWKVNADSVALFHSLAAKNSRHLPYSFMKFFVRQPNCLFIRVIRFPDDRCFIRIFS